MGFFDFLNQEARLDARMKRLQRENRILKKQNNIKDLEAENEKLRAKLEKPAVTVAETKEGLIEQIMDELERRKSPPQARS